MKNKKEKIVIACTNRNCEQRGFWTTFGNCPICGKELNLVEPSKTYEELFEGKPLETFGINVVLETGKYCDCYLPSPEKVGLVKVCRFCKNEVHQEKIDRLNNKYN